MKLYITDEGDPSVGILAHTYTVETPFPSENVFPDDLIWFKRQMEIIYKEFAEGRLTMRYENEKDTDEPEDWEIDCLTVYGR